MNEPPGARARVGLTGLTVAEYFRDEEGKVFKNYLYYLIEIFKIKNRMYYCLLIIFSDSLKLAQKYLPY